MSDDDDDIDFALISRLRATIISVTGHDDLPIPSRSSSEPFAHAEEACLDEADADAEAEEGEGTQEDVGFTVEDWKAMEEEELKNMRSWQAEEEEEEEGGEEEEGEGEGEEEVEGDKGEEDNARRNVHEESRTLDIGDARAAEEIFRGLAGDDVDKDDGEEEDEGVEVATDEARPCPPTNGMDERPWISSSISGEGHEGRAESGTLRLMETYGRADSQSEMEGEQGRGGEDDDAGDLASAGHRAASHDGGGEGERDCQSTGAHTERCAAGSRTPGMSRSAKVQYNKHVKLAKELEGAGDVGGALANYEAARSLMPNGSEKLDKKIGKLAAMLAEKGRTEAEVRRQSCLLEARRQSIMADVIHKRRESGIQDREGVYVEGGGDGGVDAELVAGWNYDTCADQYCVEGRGGFFLDGDAYRRLLPYQREGVAFLCGLHYDTVGGILGDDMGLGKTCQTVTFLGGCARSMPKFRALVIAPVSVLSVWAGEFGKFAPHITPKVFHGSSVSQRLKNLESVGRRGGVCLTSYGLASTNAEKLAQTDWDYVVCDEGHRLKRAGIKTSKMLRLIPAKHRLLLTGTPMQNNLDELWALFDFVVPGLLGDASSFQARFSRVIVDGVDRDATDSEVHRGSQRAADLRELIAPYQLARSKAQVFPPNREGAEAQGGGEGGGGATDSRGLELTSNKTEWVVWVKPSVFQEKVYRLFLESDQVREALNTTRSPLAALTVLKKICDHPYLLEKKGGEDDEEAPDRRGYVTRLLHQWRNRVPPQDECGVLPEGAPPEARLALMASSKLAFVVRLLQDLRDGGHRTLIFTQSVRMLDMLQQCLRVVGITMLRIDGSVTSVHDRQQIIDRFNSDASVHCLLLTTGVGGVGITLTGADRVVIYDPSWNPATDAQAVDRAFRVGQKRDVTVYRVVTCGTVEEKILRNQIFKRGLHHIVVSSENQQRYFTRQQLRSLFEVGDTTSSATHASLELALAQHSHRVVPAPEVASHRQKVEEYRGVASLTDYHELFSLRPAQLDGEEWEGEGDDAPSVRRGGATSRGRKTPGTSKKKAAKEKEGTSRAIAETMMMGQDGNSPVLRGSPIWIDSDDEYPSRRRIPDPPPATKTAPPPAPAPVSTNATNATNPPSVFDLQTPPRSPAPTNARGSKPEVPPPMGGKDNDLSAAVGSGISGYATPPFDELDNGSGDNGSGDIDGRARRGDSPFRGTPIPGSPRCNEDGYVREPTTPPPPSFDSPPPCAATPSPIRTPINSTSGNQTPINSTSGNQTPINSTSGDTPEAREQGESFSTPNGAPQQQQHQQQQHDDFVTPPETPTSTPASPTLSSAGAGSGEGAGAAISIDVTAGTPSPCTPPPTDFAFPRDGRSAAGYASERPRQQMSGRCTDMYNRHLAEGASAEKKILELGGLHCACSLPLIRRALWAYLKALELADDDMRLQARAHSLSLCLAALA